MKNFEPTGISGFSLPPALSAAADAGVRACPRARVAVRWSRPRWAESGVRRPRAHRAEAGVRHAAAGVPIRRMIADFLNAKQFWVPPCPLGRAP